MTGGLIFLILALPLGIPVVLAFTKNKSFSRTSFLFFKNKMALSGVFIVALLVVYMVIIDQIYIAGGCIGGIGSGFNCENFVKSKAEFIGVSQFFVQIYLMVFGAPALVLLLIAEVKTRVFQKK